MFNIRAIHIVVIISIFYWSVFIITTHPKKKGLTLLEIEEENRHLWKDTTEGKERGEKESGESLDVLKDRGELSSADGENLSLLKKRAEDVWAKCQKSTVPSSPEMKNAIRAKNVSQQLTQMFEDQHTKKISSRIFYLQKQKIVWCPLPKVASTSISKTLLDEDQLAESDDSYPQSLLRKQYRMPKSLMPKSKFAETESFVVVREPMERLVSAYKNKLVNTSTNTDGVYFYNTYSKGIIAQYRRKGESLEEDVSFAEFVDYLLNTDPYSYDDHWKPAYIYCSLCSVKFKYVLHHDNFITEFSSLMKAVFGYVKVLHENKSPHSGDGTKLYLDMLDAEKRKQLVRIYSLDYYILGYDINKYL